MKTTMRLRSLVLAALASLSLGFGCASQNEKTSVTNVISAQPAPNNVVTNLPVAATVVEAAPEPVNKVEPVANVSSPGLAEIVKMAQSGVDENVLITYIDNSNIAYNPSADEIMYLNDLGVSPRVVTKLIQHGRELTDQVRQAAAAAAATSAAAAAAVSAPPPETGYAPPTQTSVAPVTQGVTETVAPAAAPTAYAVETAPQTIVYQPPTTPVTVQYFYQSLSPYGTWMEIPGYGWCWQPTVVVTDPGWHPYFHRGRWLYSDYGWYWHSYYSWGWAPFHYGRWWHHSRCGWLWTPDTVWGPSWVVWRSTPSYCGWAPLPPRCHYGPHGFVHSGFSVGVGYGFGLTSFHFAFVSSRYVCNPHPYHHRIHGSQQNVIYKDSTVINNYFMGPNNIVINKGIDPGRMPAMARSEMRKVEVRELPPSPGNLARPGGLEKEGNQWVAYRPPVANSPDGGARLGANTTRQPVGSSGTPQGPSQSRGSEDMDLRHPSLITRTPVASGSKPSVTPMAPSSIAPSGRVTQSSSPGGATLVPPGRGPGTTATAASSQPATMAPREAPMRQSATQSEKSAVTQVPTTPPTMQPAIGRSAPSTSRSLSTPRPAAATRQPAAVTPTISSPEPALRPSAPATRQPSAQTATPQSLIQTPLQPAPSQPALRRSSAPATISTPNRILPTPPNSPPAITTPATPAVRPSYQAVPSAPSVSAPSAPAPVMRSTPNVAPQRVYTPAAPTVSQPLPSASRPAPSTSIRPAPAAPSFAPRQAPTSIPRAAPIAPASPSPRPSYSPAPAPSSAPASRPPTVTIQPSGGSRPPPSAAGSSTRRDR